MTGRRELPPLRKAAISPAVRGDVAAITETDVCCAFPHKAEWQSPEHQNLQQMNGLGREIVRRLLD